jgi:integrase
MIRKRRLPKNVSAYIDRHGKERFRYRKTGQPVGNFQHPFGTKEFDLELQRFRNGEKIKVQRYAPGTVGWLAGRYRTSMAFMDGKSAETERNAWAILEKFVTEFANDRIQHFEFSHIEAVLANAVKKRLEGKRMVGGPHAARNLRGELLPFFRYAVKLKLIPNNPVELSAIPKAPKSSGFHSWTDEEIEQYRDHWPMGTNARLALEIFLWTWARRGDGSTFGRSHLKNGKITYTHAKTGETVTLPAAPQLLEAIEAMPVIGAEVFLLTSFGKPYTKAGLGNKMREWCDAAGLPHCSAHGLRKAAARRSAEHGGTNAGLKAAGGWTTDQQVNTYTRAASREQLAKQAIEPVIQADLANRSKKVSQKEG